MLLKSNKEHMRLLVLLVFHELNVIGTIPALASFLNPLLYPVRQAIIREHTGSRFSTNNKITIKGRASKKFTF